MNRPRRDTMGGRGGTILVAVLVVTAMAAMLATSLLYQMRAEVSASAAVRAHHQAYAVAQSGVQRALAVLQASAADPAVWYDNPGLFLNQFVCTDSRGDTWYFTLYAPGDAELGEPRYGLSDEAGKINLNVVPASVLALLPGMTSERVDCLLDYLDADNEPRAEGAEQLDYYSKLKPPYLIKNGPLATLEELLLVKGFTGSVVYGEDYNLNGLLEPSENDGDDSFPPDNRDGVLDTGLMGVATVISYERNVDANGRARVNLNTASAAALASAGLSQTTVQFIQAYRADGGTFKHPSQLLNMQYEPNQQAEGAGGGGGRGGGGRGGGAAGGRGGGAGGRRTLSSGVDAQNLATVLDRCTTDTNTVLRGLVNVNTASRQVLSLLPGFDENLAQQIVDARSALEAGERTTIAWLVSRNVVEPDQFKEVAPYLTARSLQFRLRCVGFGSPSGRFCALEVVVDLASGTPTVLYTRDVTRLGMPVPVVTEQLPGSPIL